MTAALAAPLGAPLLRAAAPRLMVGITDWNLRLSANPDAIPLAARLGFDGVQVSCGRKLVDGKMSLDHPETLARCVALAKQHRIPIDGTCADRLHENGLKSDPLAVGFVRDAIRMTQALGTQVLLLPFFGKWALATRAEMEYTGDALRELGPEAVKAKVILGLENTISAEDNVRIMERSRCPNVLVYYDVGNSTGAGFDVLKELRWLGAARICQIHLKDNPGYLGEGKIAFAPIVKTIVELGFTGYANLETDAKSAATLEADMQRNLGYVRGMVRALG